MKRIISLLGALTLLLCMLGSLPALAAGSVSLSADKTTVTVGSTVTVTVKCDGGGKGIGSMDAYFHYNAKAFEYQSCDGATANGGAGNLKISYYATTNDAPKTLSITLTFKAIGVGDGGFKWETEGMYDDEDNLLSNASKTLSVTANNPTKSGDATLAYLRPSKGTLTPKFDKNVTEYTVSVPYTVTRLLLTYDTTHPDATEEITDNANLQVGKTVRVITVTAPNGTVKKYSITVTREAQQDTTTSPSGSSNTTTAPSLPQQDDLEVEVNGTAMYVADTRPTVTLPHNYEWDSVEINGIEVPAAKQPTSGLVLVYLTTQEDSKEGAFYLYDALSDTFAPFCELESKQAFYTLHNLPNTETGPVGTIPGTFAAGEHTVTAYVYEDTALADYVLLYLTAPNGETGLYTYDRTDGSLQRYYQQPAEVITETDPKPDPGEDDDKPGAFAAFVIRYQAVILTIAFLCCGLALLIAAIIFAARLLPGSRRKGKH
ncbi:MAG: cadherin-like beta sandwich domain-containing protein [Clostridia bacterium]|nr:cadherin-like beta sandwich domain-containing protein [Clostridia bacterium]